MLYLLLIYIENKLYVFRAGEENFIKDLGIQFPGEENNIRNYIKLVKKIEKQLKMKAKIKLKPKISLDPEKTLADTSLIRKYTGKNYKTSIDKGLEITIKWLKNYLK